MNRTFKCDFELHICTVTRIHAIEYIFFYCIWLAKCAYYFVRCAHSVEIINFFEFSSWVEIFPACTSQLWIFDALVFHTRMHNCEPCIHFSELCDPIHIIFILTKANCQCGSSKWIIYSIKLCKECFKNLFIRTHARTLTMKIGSKIIRLFILLHFLFVWNSN